MLIKAGNIRKGSYVLFKNTPHYVTKTDFMSPGKGSAFMRCKMRSVATANTVEFTFKSTEQIEELEVSNREMQFLFKDDGELTFMDQRSYEQETIPAALIEEKIDLLTPDMTVYIMFYDEKAIGVNFPPKVKLKVTYADDAVAGDTVNQAKKPVKLETGLEVMAPLFIKTGDTLIIDTETKSYVSRG